MKPDLVPLSGTLLERLARIGVDVEAALQLAAIPRSRFSAPSASGTTAELFSFWRAVGELSATADVGLRAGTDTLPQHQTVAYLAALHSPTLADGLTKLARYKRLVCPEGITIHVSKGEARIRFEWVHADIDPPTVLIDCVFAGIIDIARRGSGTPLPACRVELTRRRAHEGLLRAHFGCDIRFDSPFNVLVLDEASLALPFATHNAQLLALLLPGLESALEATVGARTLLDDVRMAISHRICGERPAVEKVAKSLGMSPRTLQRRLGEVGTSYQRLLDEVRRQTARRLLSVTNLEASEVAFLLGFEELNSFSRAFHSWEGTTPTRFRAAVR